MIQQNTETLEDNLRFNKLSKLIQIKLSQYFETYPSAVQCQLVCFDRDETRRKVLSYDIYSDFDKLFWVESIAKPISSYSYGHQIDKKDIDKLDREFILDTFLGIDEERG
ncbi:hypothetical protein [Streptococcus suis]|uniref:hypothetical protein n=1 Tax=Streptococcus suis TaxID=1307 RepID=UPI000CF6DE85|nr:hypothetical protein [Streptococcus suis]